MFNVLFITKALIRMCDSQADLRLCWSHTTKSGLVGRIFANDHCFIKMDGKNFPFSVKKTKWKENPSILGDFSFQKDKRSDCGKSGYMWW